MFWKRKILIILLVGFLGGCAKLSGPSIGQNNILHESQESLLLSEVEFINRVQRSANLIYEGLKDIKAAVELYALDHEGTLPDGPYEQVVQKLIDDGYLEKWPEVPLFAFTEPYQREIKYYRNYDDADSNGVQDTILFVQDLKIEVCEEFSRLYASPGLAKDVYDFEANNKRYPGEAIGRDIKIYTIIWSKKTMPDFCDIHWVLKYND